MHPSEPGWEGAKVSNVKVCSCTWRSAAPSFTYLLMGHTPSAFISRDPVRSEMRQLAKTEAGAGATSRTNAGFKRPPSKHPRTSAGSWASTANEVAQNATIAPGSAWGSNTSSWQAAGGGEESQESTEAARGTRASGTCFFTLVLRPVLAACDRSELPTYAVSSSFMRPSLEATVVNTRQGYNNGCRSIAVLSGRVPRFKPRRRPPSSTPTRARVDPSSPFLSFSLNCILLKARGYGSQTMQSTVL